LSFVTHRVIELAADQALGFEDRVVRVGHGLALGGLADDFRRSAAKPTIEGVVLAPSALAMTSGSPPSSTASRELVVPRSDPTHFSR
jgi:hypothetical protein